MQSVTSNSNPLKYIEDYALLNTSYFTFHFEAVKNIEEVIDEIGNYGLKVGVSIKPDTDIEVLFPYLKNIDQVLVMSVYPGKSGQEFINESVDRIRTLKDEIINQNTNTIISVDGGINDETGRLCMEAGADMLVSASYVHKNLYENINILKNMKNN